MSRLMQRSSTNCWSALDSSPRRLWLMWTALRPTPRDSRGVELAAWIVRRRATESAPPETATQMRSPGLMLERSKSRVGETDIWNEDTVPPTSESSMADLHVHLPT